jgi:hypothetical protein
MGISVALIPHLYGGVRKEMLAAPYISLSLACAPSAQKDVDCVGVSCLGYVVGFMDRAVVSKTRYR